MFRAAQHNIARNERHIACWTKHGSSFAFRLGPFDRLNVFQFVALLSLLSSHLFICPR
jgi:hypothetical protein